MYAYGIMAQRVNRFVVGDKIIVDGENREVREVHWGPPYDNIPLKNSKLRRQRH